MKNSIIILILALAVPTTGLLSQCANWVGSPDEEAGTEAHSIYRSSLKAKDFSANTFDNWQKAYSIAPAADGQRPFHFVDGIKLYKNKLEANAQDTEAKERIASLYDELISCYKSGGIKEPKCQDQACRDSKAAKYMGRKAVDMYYVLNAPYSKNLEALQAAVAAAGNDTEYTLFRPVADIAVYQFQKGKLDQKQTRDIFELMTGIAEHNIENNEKYGEYYANEQKALNSKFKEIERDIFDCTYFVNKWEEGYRADPTPENAKKIYNQLRLQGCDESEPFYVELKSSYEKWAASVNAEKKAEYEASHPGILANKAYKAGNYQEAINKYQEALGKETDITRKSVYNNSIASIQFRKMNDNNGAISSAKKAVSQDPTNGKAYMLLGDIYAKKSRSCGDDWKTRLVIKAAMDKYSEAKSADPTVSDEASKKLGIYSSSLPQKTEGFMRKVKEGQIVNCGCGINEKVRVRFAK